MLVVPAYSLHLTFDDTQITISKTHFFYLKSTNSSLNKHLDLTPQLTQPYFYTALYI